MEGALTKGDQQRAEEFDRIHQEAAAKLTLGGKNHPSAKELASGYTKGCIPHMMSRFIVFKHILLL
jgi:hypothetical protein